MNKILEALKKLFFPQSFNRNEERPNGLELVDMAVNPEPLEMNLVLPSDSVVIENEELATAEQRNHEDEEIVNVTDLVEEDEAIEQHSECQTEQPAANVSAKEDNPSVQTETSLLDNASYMSLADSLTSLMEEIEDVGDLSSSELVEIVKCRLQEGFLISGAELIAEDKVFDAIRHTPVPPAMVKQGAPIEKTIEPGIIINDKVIRKAKVEMKKQETLR